MTSYQYDRANRLTDSSTGGNTTTYTYDNNGNLLNDGVITYTYDSANRLTAVSNQQSASSYQYSELGDRLSQTVNGITTTYTLDLNAGLTQVLNDGTNAYIYGVGRIAQVNTTIEYFLGDALGSVRQLVDSGGTVTLAKSYAPYGETRSSAGSGTSIYSYTGEQQDASGLTYLRSRYYASSMGRFISRDTWSGNANMPMSYNRWSYGYGNPISYTDPTGHFPVECLEADDFAQCLRDWAMEGKGDCDTDPVSLTPINCDELPGPKSRNACKTYLALRDHSGWWSNGPWNGNRPGPLSPQAFAGLLLRMEFSNSGGTGFNNVDHSIQQETVVRNFYAHCSGWTGNTCNSRSANDIFIFLGHKRLLDDLRPGLILPETADSDTIARVWRNDPGYSNADFEYGFLNPGAWTDGWGKQEYVPDPKSDTGYNWVYTAPFDWGNISMIPEPKYSQARLLINKNWEHAEGLAEWQFFIRRGKGDTATIMTLSQRRYWRGT